MSDRMSLEQVAEYIPAAVNTVRFWRSMGQGPRSYKLGRRVMYDRDDVDAWIAEQKEKSRRPQ